MSSHRAHNDRCHLACVRLLPTRAQRSQRRVSPARGDINSVSRARARIDHVAVLYGAGILPLDDILCNVTRGISGDGINVTTIDKA